MEAKVVLDRMINRSEADKLKELLSIWTNPNINRYMKLKVDDKEIELFYSVRRQYFIIKGDLNTISKIFGDIIPIIKVEVRVQFYPEKIYNYEEFVDLVIRFHPRKHIMLNAIDNVTAELLSKARIDITNEFKCLLSRVKRFKLLDTRMLYLVFNVLRTLSILGKKYTYVNIGLLTRLADYYYLYINEKRLSQEELKILKNKHNYLIHNKDA